MKLLEPYRKELPPAVFTEPFKLPVTDGSGNNREQLRHALDLLQQAGWSVKERKLVDKTGNQMSFTILLDEPSLERVALPYVQLLQKLGIDARVRTVDPAQYQHLTDDFDFDMIMMIYPEGDIPGNELRGYFSCAAAKAQGSFNTPGICDPAVDAMIERIVMAQDRETLTTAARALDRVLLWRWYRGAELGQPDLPHRLLGPLRPSGQADPRGVQLRYVVGGRGEIRGDCRGKAAVMRIGPLPPTPSRKGRGSSSADCSPSPCGRGLGEGAPAAPE